MSKETRTVNLVVPIHRDGEEAITQIELKKPFAGEMRGLNFTDILQMEVETMTTLIPRISNLTERDMINLEPSNYAPLFTEVISFFVDTSSQMSE